MRKSFVSVFSEELVDLFFLGGVKEAVEAVVVLLLVLVVTFASIAVDIWIVAVSFFPCSEVLSSNSDLDAPATVSGRWNVAAVVRRKDGVKPSTMDASANRSGNAAESLIIRVDSLVRDFKKRNDGILINENQGYSISLSHHLSTTTTTRELNSAEDGHGVEKVSGKNTSDLSDMSDRYLDVK